MCFLRGTPGYSHVKEYVDFYENRSRVRQNRDYNRKYHVENILSRYNMARKDRTRFLERFADVESRLDKLGIKPFPKMTYLFENIFDELGIVRERGKSG